MQDDDTSHPHAVPRAQPGVGYGVQHGAQPGAQPGTFPPQTHGAQAAMPSQVGQAQHAAPAYATHPAQPQQSFQPQQPGPQAQQYATAVQAAPSHQSPHGYGAHPAPQAAYTAQDSDGAMPPPKLGPAQWAGAAVSLSLVALMGFWGVNQMIRDVSGVPVIRAMDGEARAVPEDPGGQLAMHQGLAVNTVTADGSAAAPADRLALAPRPTALLAEDQPMRALEVEPALVAYTPETNAYATDADTLALENVEQTSAPADVVVQLDVDVDVPDAPEDDVVAGMITTSPVPKLKPKRAPAPDVKLAAAEVVETAAPAAPKKPRASLEGVAGDILAAVGSADEAAVSDIAADTPMVQLGAFPEAAAARAEWDRLVTKFPQFLEDKQRVIGEASSGGKTFYRLRAVGFVDTASSQSFCAAFEAMNTPCVPIKQN